jgi:hypothetical protein
MAFSTCLGKYGNMYMTIVVVFMWSVPMCIACMAFLYFVSIQHTKHPTFTPETSEIRHGFAKMFQFEE